MNRSDRLETASTEISASAHSGNATLAWLPVKAFELLAAQPATLVGLSQAERDRVVVSAVVDQHGCEHVVSRVGDTRWDFTVDVWTPNTPASGKLVDWRAAASPAFLNDIRASLYVWLKRGRENAQKPIARSVVDVGKQAAQLVAHLTSKGLKSFSDVTALHLSDYIAELKKTHRPESIARRLYIVDLVWDFHEEVLWPLPQHPWAGQSLVRACGVVKGGGWDGELPSGLTAKTPVIPPSVQATLFAHAEAHLIRSEQYLLARDRDGGSPTSFALTALRDSIAYLIQVTTGMRNSELAGIKSGSWRTEIRDGVTFHWIRTTEHKTKKGEVDYLAPPQALKALEILQKYAEPLQARLRDEIRWLESQLALAGESVAVLSSGMTRVSALQRLVVARKSVNGLFLGVSKKASDHTNFGRIEVLGISGFGAAMDRFALIAGVDWNLTTHQCRRTFAWTVANTRLGKRGLLFLKWQLKHSTMTMTQLYASNPNQDAVLYEEFCAELVDAQSEVLESWFEDEAQLSGGAGKRIMKTRATPVADRASLLELTAESVTIRSTGHSWCLAEGGACVGEGVYEAIRCGTCSDGVIDDTYKQVWQGIHFHNLELLKLKDCGPAVEQRAKRVVEQSAQVLRDLGVEVPTFSSDMKVEENL